MNKHVALRFERLDEREQLQRSREYLERMRMRRTVRMFSPEAVPFELIENAVRVASLAPSGANLQPWRFVIVTESALKHQIREAAEAEEKEFYEKRCPPEWLAALEPLGTDWHKPFLEEAPLLIVVFRVDYSVRHASGEEKRLKHYYVQESVGIAVGFLLSALHLSGLATLTHTPSPMGFLNRILDRPKNERPFVVLPVGFPSEAATVPAIEKKPMQDVMVVR